MKINKKRLEEFMMMAIANSQEAAEDADILTKEEEKLFLKFQDENEAECKRMFENLEQRFRDTVQNYLDAHHPSFYSEFVQS